MRNKSYVIILFIILIFQSCAALPVPEQELSHADNLFSSKKYNDALTGYRKVLQDYPGSHAAAEAQFSIAYTLICSDNSDMDYEQALEEFDKFIKLYPDDSMVYEANNWRTLLKTLSDARKENLRLNSKIDQLKQLDIRREKMSR